MMTKPKIGEGRGKMMLIFSPFEKLKEEKADGLKSDGNEQGS